MPNTIDQTLDYLLKAISPNPDTISVETTTENDIVKMLISAPPESIGQIIGREGRIIKAIRSIITLSYPTTRYLIEFKDSPKPLS